MLVGEAYGDVILSWNSVSGRSYAVGSRPLLEVGVWGTLTSGVGATEPLNTVTVAPGMAHGFMRIELSRDNS